MNAIRAVVFSLLLIIAGLCVLVFNLRELNDHLQATNETLMNPEALPHMPHDVDITALVSNDGNLYVFVDGIFPHKFADVCGPKSNPF